MPLLATDQRQPTPAVCTVVNMLGNWLVLLATDNCRGYCIATLVLLLNGPAAAAPKCELAQQLMMACHLVEAHMARCLHVATAPCLLYEGYQVVGAKAIVDVGTGMRSTSNYTLACQGMTGVPAAIWGRERLLPMLMGSACKINLML